MKLSRMLLILAALTLMPLHNAEADLILNGGFEQPDIPTGTFAVFAAIPGWTTTFGPGIEIQDHVAGSPFEGAQHVELDSFGNSGMIQTVVPTTPGQIYDFRFAYSPRPGVPATSNGIEVYFNGGLLTTIAVSGVGLTDTSWAVFTFAVAATGTHPRSNSELWGQATHLAGTWMLCS